MLLDLGVCQYLQCEALRLLACSIWNSSAAAFAASTKRCSEVMASVACGSRARVLANVANDALFNAFQLGLVHLAADGLIHCINALGFHYRFLK